MAKFSQFQSLGKGVSEEDIKNKYDTFKNMSKEDLGKTLFQEVAKQKADGTFNYSQLEGMVNSLQGVLPEADYENVRKLLESLK